MAVDEVDKVIIHFINNDTKCITNSKEELDEIEQTNDIETSIIQIVLCRCGN